MTGFETPEIDVLIGELDSAQEEDPADEVPEFRDGPPVSRPGDHWLIGKHRLLCGDETDPEAYARLLDGVEVQMVFIDPLSFPKTQRGWILSIRAFEAVWLMPEMFALPVV